MRNCWRVIKFDRLGLVPIIHDKGAIRLDFFDLQTALLSCSDNASNICLQNGGGAAGHKCAPIGFSRAPTPPPVLVAPSPINSIPARSKADKSASIVGLFPAMAPACASSLFTVAMLTPEAPTKSDCDQFKSALAARHCSLLSGASVNLRSFLFYMILLVLTK